MTRTAGGCITRKQTDRWVEAPHIDEKTMNQDAQTTAFGEVIVMLNLHFKPSSAEKVLEKMVPSIRLTRMEPGNNEFQIFKVKGSEDKFVVFERWKD